MKKFTTIITASLLTLAISSSAFAGNHGNHGNQQAQPWQQQTQGKDNKKPQKPQHQQNSQRQNQANANANADRNHGTIAPQQNQRAPQHQSVKQSAQWQVGHQLPQQYRDQGHRVDYQQHHLPKPGKNQRWVQIDGEYILINVLTNTIVQVLLNS